MVCRAPSASRPGGRIIRHATPQATSAAIWPRTSYMPHTLQQLQEPLQGIAYFAAIMTNINTLYNGWLGNDQDCIKISPDPSRGTVSCWSRQCVLPRN